MQDFMNPHKEGIYFYSYEYAPIEHVSLIHFRNRYSKGEQGA